MADLLSVPRATHELWHELKMALISRPGVANTCAKPNIGGNEEITSGYNLEAENDLHEETLDYMMDGGFFQDDLTPVFDDVLHCLTDKKPRRKYTSGTSSMESMLKNTVKKSQSMEWNVTGAGANAIYAKKEESDVK